MGDAKQARVGIVAADPVRALGLESILRDNLSVDPQVCDLVSAMADHDLAVLLLDDRFEGEDVIATVGRLQRDRPELKLIVLGEASDAAYIQSVMGAGALGYLLETTTEDEIRMAMDAVLGGSRWAPRKVLARLVDGGGLHDGNADQGARVSGQMTSRERQVLDLLIGGKSNREIGNTLGIDEVTVKAHLGRMLRKTQSKNRVELTLRALEERNTPRRDTADA